MRIAGIYPQYFALDTKTQHMYGSPTGLENILAIAKEAGHEVRLFTPIVCNGNGYINMTEEQFVSEIERFAPDIAAFSLMTCQFNTGTRIARALKRRKKELIVVAGGRHPTVDPVPQYPFDFYVMGEGEVTFRELLSEITGKQDYTRVESLVYIDRDGTTKTNKPRPLTEFNSALLVWRDDKLLKQEYCGLSYPPLSQRPRYALLEYSRGCKGTCYFCDARKVWKGTVRHKQVGRVVAEMKQVIEKYGISLFYIIDLNFTIDKRKVMEFCGELHRQGVNTSWYCMSNIETADAEMMGAMKEAGCFKIAWGVESTSDESRGRMKKSLRDGIVLGREQITQKLELSAKIGLINNIFYIIGFPWQTEDSILKETTVLSEYKAHQLNIGLATPFPGTQWYREIDKNLLNPNLELYDRSHLVYQHNTLSEEKLKLIQEQVYRSFYFSKEYLIEAKRLTGEQPQLRDSFNDYFQFLGLTVRV